MKTVEQILAEIDRRMTSNIQLMNLGNTVAAGAFDELGNLKDWITTADACEHIPKTVCTTTGINLENMKLVHKGTEYLTFGPNLMPYPNKEGWRASQFIILEVKENEKWVPARYIKPGKAFRIAVFGKESDAHDNS